MRTTNNQIIQSTLTVNAPGDAYEQEADAVASRVMSAANSDTTAISNFTPPNISRIQASGLANGGFEAPAEVEARIQRMQGGGQALPDSEVNFFAQRMGYDFSGVRIHTDANAVQASRDIQAKAFTVGNNIAFDAGAYQPGTSAGRHLLAHELTHVVQQGHANRAGLQRKPAQVQREDDGTWEWTSAQGQNLNVDRSDIEVEAFTQRFLGLIMPARATLSYNATARKSHSTTDATVDIQANARFRRFTSIGRIIGTGWETHNANMSQTERWQIDPTSGNITTGPTSAIVEDHPIDGPLAVTAGITRRVEEVNDRQKKLVMSINTKAVVEGEVSETGGVSGGVSAGGHEGAVGSELGAEASTSWSISYHGGESFDIYRANYIFIAEKKGGTDTGGDASGGGGGG